MLFYMEIRGYAFSSSFLNGLALKIEILKKNRKLQGQHKVGLMGY